MKNIFKKITVTAIALATDAKMYGLNNIVSLGELWRIADGGYYSEI